MIFQPSFYFICNGDAKQAESAAYTLKDMEISKIFTSVNSIEMSRVIADICVLDCDAINEFNSPEDSELYKIFKSKVLYRLNKILLDYQYPLIIAESSVFDVLIKELAYRNYSYKNGEIFLFTKSLSQPKKWDVSLV